ncbi:MAG: hypothetical protein CM1200mP29_17000 [Verrucomicrobiota bacterium]|nr:MAG: hypothetical protein CM1200mP29_17000 [Verrucomicrobiota bacterium]
MFKTNKSKFPRSFNSGIISIKAIFASESVAEKPVPSFYSIRTIEYGGVWIRRPGVYDGGEETV